MNTTVGEKPAAAVPQDLAGWHICASSLRAKQSALAAEKTELTTRRQTLALAATIGDGRAKKRIEQLAAREAVLEIDTVSLGHALEHADAEIAAAEATRAAATRHSEVIAHAELLTARLALVRTIEQHLHEMTPLLEALGEATREVVESHLALGGMRGTLPPLASEAVGGRLCEFMAGIGFADWLPLVRPEIRPALASLLDAETLAQESYGVSS